MKVRSQRTQLPFVRTGLGTKEKLVVAGLVGAALLIQRLRGRTRRKLKTDVHAEPQKVQVQEASLPDDLNDWAASIAPVQPQDADKHLVVLLDEELPLAPKELWRLIYDPNFVQMFYMRRKNRESRIGKWGIAGGELIRRAQYITPVKKNAFGPCEAYTEEEHRCRRRGEGGFDVLVCAYTRQVPYGGSFHVELHWTATRTSQMGTKLHVAGGIVFEKRILVGGIVKRATLEGLRETYADYKDHLSSTIRAGGLPKGTPSNAAPSAARSASAAVKAAAEDLVNNGVFVSWGQLIMYLLLVCLCYSMVRLSMLGDGRLLCFHQVPWGSKDPVFPSV